jgi:hypothetical protein
MELMERGGVLREGAHALRAVEGARRALLPPPDRENVSLLREIRDIMALADRVESALLVEGNDQESVWGRDAILSMEFSDYEIDMLRTLAHDDPVSRRPLHDLASLLARYMAGEFMPPDSFFGIRAPEV